MKASISPRTHSLLRWASLLGGALGTFLVASRANAQIDIAPPLPNVLLLVDTSGSMEYKTDGSTVTCNPGNQLLTNEKSRWINVVEVLTGTFNDYSCEALDRVSSSYKTGEYVLSTGTAPYDWRYPIPYHRPLSGGTLGCAAAPGTLPGTAPNANPFKYPINPIRYHKWSDVSFNCSQSQTNDGILDAFGSRVRFGLMTFDTEVDEGRGYAPAAGNYTSATADTLGGQTGLYSYIVGATAVGRPMGCVTPSVAQEVGARNGSAPAWEGRMVNFGNPNDSEKVYETKARRIQEVLVATRPFGATPIAGMLRDAEDFFWNDASDDPDVFPTSAPNPFDDYGPRLDPYLACLTPRQQTIILLTDGEPNMDLRPYCAETPVGGLPAGACPFDLPEDIAERLANPASASRKPIKTYVVGFALEQVDHDLNPATANVSCGTLDPDGSDCTAPGAANDVPLSACCTLLRIAAAGEGQAFFASNAGELRSAISDILRRSVPTTSRTQPAISAGSATTGGAFRFFSGFEVGQLALWNGQLTRERWECVAPDSTSPKVPTRQAMAPAKGDDFVENVNNAGPANRLFYTVVPKSSSGVVAGMATVRKNIGPTDPDGAGTLIPEIHTGLAAAFAAAVPSAALAIPTAAYPTGITAADAARTFFLQWLVGVNATNAPYHRCRNSGNCELIGDIYHSTPQIVGAPSEGLQDASYDAFATGLSKRPIVLYTSTNDGFLHAFKVTSNDPADVNDDVKKVMVKTNNELWAFAPPAVLPSLHGLYPYNHQNLLDGVATVSDVVAVKAIPSTNPPTVFERTAADAQGGGGTWRTVLVQGFGAGRGGYFALDVTNPVPDASNPADTEKGGPRFLWQLTRDSAGNELFGRAGGNPAITTLFFDPSGGTNPREIPVAILPGGNGGTPTSVACPKPPETPRTFTGINIDSRFVPRGQVTCYDWGAGDAERGARSLTIVRLDTGEIIRHFRQKKVEVASTTLQNRTTEAELDSPITGQPVAFPGRAGAVADRIIVGDRDGRLWKVNVASTKPAEWTMKLFFDLYPASISSTAKHDFDDGQPIATPPVLSVDDNGDMTVNVATGDQDALGYSTSQVNYVYSLIEDFDGNRTTATHKANWLQPLTNGERVVGPLVLFNSNLYFATFLGASGSNVCATGTSRLWGMNYVLPQNPSNFQQGGLAALLDGTPPLVQSITHDDAVIFGVSLAKQPTCFSRLDDAVGNDLFGFQGRTTVTQVTPAKFELVMQTSPTSATAGQAPTQVSRTLEAPASFARVVSWASVVE